MRVYVCVFVAVFLSAAKIIYKASEEINVLETKKNDI